MLHLSVRSFAQDNNDDDYDAEQNINKKGFHTGVFLGGIFPNNYTATLYDGYGFDYNENKNDFANSFMYEKIIMQYGGGDGQTDLIAEALGIDHTDWSFDESDMPVNMRYHPAFLIGFDARYGFNKKNSLLFNLNVAQLTINGNFTITTRPPPNSTQINNSIKTYDIKGGEQRMTMQAGYQRIFGESVNINFFMEGGLQLTYARFLKNEIMIEELHINLADSYVQTGYASTELNKPTGTGIGVFAGLGINLTLNSKWSVQFVYNPSYEKINIGYHQKRTLQNAVGFRTLINLSVKKSEE